MTADARERMVEAHLRARGIRDARVIDAMRRVPREAYVPEADRAHAYLDGPLAIGCGQTISQPYVVAFMTEALALAADDVVLEIGTGSGYQTAVLAELVREVYSVELVQALSARAERTLAEQGYRNVHLRIGDGYAGWPEHAPYSKIVVTAAPAAVPPALVDQLAVGGRMIVPVGPQGGDQELQVLTKTPDGLDVAHSLPVRFVPMVRGDQI